MKALAVVLCALVCVTVVPVASALDQPDQTFQVQWAIFIPMNTYFLGETVSFRVEAYASTNPDLKIPDQYAHVMIRNESHLEVWDTWIATDTNGSAWIEWETELEYDLGNYSVYLEDGFGFITMTSVVLLFDENTYWQKRLSDLQEQIDVQNDYLNYLFEKDTWVTRKLNTALKNQIVLGIGFFICFLATFWVFCREWVRCNAMDIRKRMGFGGALASLMGVTNVPKCQLTGDHEEVANLLTPPDRAPLRYGRDWHCPACDPKKLLPMTERAYELHMQDFHERKLSGLRAYFKKRGFKKLLSEVYPKEAEKPVFLSEDPKEIARQNILERASEIRADFKRGALSKDELRAEVTKLKFEAEKAGLVAPEPKPVYKTMTSAKHEKMTQPQEETTRKLPANGRTRKIRTY